MKAIAFTGILLLSFFFSYAGNKTVLQTEPDHITLYSSGAEIHRESNFTFEKGLQTIVFDSLSPYLNTASIQAQGKGNYTILDVKFVMKQPDPLDPSLNQLPPKIIKEINLLKDSIRLLSYTQQDFNNQLEVLRLEKGLLMNNQLVRGNGGDTIPELQQTMDFFRSKLNNINAQILKAEKERFPVDQSLNRMNTRLHELQSYNQIHNPQPVRQAVPQVEVQIIGNTAGSGSMELSYLVNNAGWYASYDIRANDNGKTELIYKANVYQNTGKAWENVEITLSTMNPNQQYNKPILPIWYLTYAPVVQTVALENSRGRYRSREVAECAPAMNEDMVLDANYASNYTQAVSNLLNVEYAIKLDYTIPTDGQYHSLPMHNKELGSEYEYYTAPAIDNNAYLMAKITDWAKLDLLQGQANIYFNGRYTGQTNIYPEITKDTMEIALGRTRNLKIDRKQLKSESEPKLVGSFVTRTVSYQIKIKNTQNKSASIKLEDWIPHSTNEELEVNLLDAGGAEFNESNSHLTWDLKIPGGQTKTIEYTFSVKYDKKKPLNMNF